ncbi:Calx-beta domain-containing protein [Gimesia alba]|nr:Calx-beta domain-containing protein [Gimesia alba]
MLTSEFSISSDFRIDEGDSGDTIATFTITRNGSYAGSLNSIATVDFHTEDDTALSAEGDYVPVSTTLTFGADSTSLKQTQTVEVIINGDILVEEEEKFKGIISHNSSGTTIRTSTADERIANDDQARISINDVTVNEAAGTAVLTVSIDKPVDSYLLIDYATAPDTATSGDFLSSSGDIYFAAGEQSKTISINIFNDERFEFEESFEVHLTGVRSYRSDVFITDDLGVVTIEPDYDFVHQFELQSKLFSPGTAGSFDEYGRSFDIDDNSMIVSSRGWDEAGENIGAAFVYTRNNQGTPTIFSDDTWDYQATLLPPVGYTTDGFGYSVAINGNTAVVSDYRDDEGAENSGAIYVYTRSNNVWTFQQKLKASEPQRVAEFGHVLKIESDMIFVGVANANGELIPGSSYPYSDHGQGAVYVFSRSGNTWSEMARLTASDPETYKHFGDSIDVDGTTLVVGAVADSDDNLHYNSGAVYVFDLQDGNWIEVQKLKSDSPHDGEYFGNSVALDGDNLVVGAVFHESFNPDTEQLDNTGAAYVFTRVDDVWLETQTLTITPDVFNSYFGTSVDIQGDLILVSSIRDPASHLITENGATYLFRKENSTWVQVDILRDLDLNDDAYFGRKIAISHDLILINAVHDNEQEQAAGSIYVYRPTDLPTISIDNMSFTEGDTGSKYVTIEVTRTSTTPGDLSIPALVHFATMDGDAKVMTGDYLGNSGTLSFEGDPDAIFQTRTFTVQIFGDTFVEKNETFLVKLSNPLGNARLLDKTATITIIEDDQSLVRIDDVSLHENEGTATIYVTLDKPVDATVSVDYSTANRTAYSTADYISTSGTITFTAGTQSQAITVPIVNNSQVETEESFYINLSHIQSEGANVDFGDSQGEVTIQDDDQTVIPLLTIEDVAVNEDAGTATLNVSLSSAIPTTVTVDYITANDTAVSPNDYLARSGTITFNPLETARTITIPIFNSDTVEADETFYVFLSNIQSGVYQVLMNDDQALVTILDKDRPRLTISDLIVNESAATATLSVNLTKAQTEAFTVEYATEDVSAYSTTDFQSSTGVLTFEAGETIQTIDIPLTDDDLVEADETFLVNLFNLQDGSLNVSILDNQAQVIIQDDDQATISIDDITVHEDAGTATLQVSLSAPVNGDVFVDFSTSDQTATSPGDYAATSGTLHFSANEQTKTITVPIVNSTPLEANKTFLVNLSHVQSNGLIVTLADNQAEVTIVDSIPLRLSIDAVTVNESGGTATLYVSLNQSIDSAFSVDFDTYSQTALSTSDYTDTSGTLVFASHETTKAITIPLINDDVAEPDETFLIVLDNIQSADYLLDFTNDQAVVTIVDEDQPELTIGSAPVYEEAGTATLTVTLSKPHAQPFSVDYTTADSGAQAGLDYQATSGTLYFGVGQTSKTISIPIFDDELVESYESILVWLSNVQTGTIGVILADNLGSVTIQKSEQATVSIEDLTVNEGDGTAFVTVSLDQEVEKTVTVAYTTEDESATSSEDYLSASGTVTFNPGETTKTIEVPLIDSSLVEGTESFAIQLSGINSGLADVIFADDRASVTILDQGLQSIFSLTPTSVLEGADGTQALTFEITRTGASPGDLNFVSSVNFSTLDGTAIAGIDYTALSTTLTFAASATGITQSQTVTINVQGDLIIEDSETLFGQLSNPTGESILAGNVDTLEATGEITNDDLLENNFEFQEPYYPEDIHANHTGYEAGNSIAVDGNYMVVGAEEKHTIYVYARNDHGTTADQSDDTWEYETVLNPTSTLYTDGFGRSVAIEGNTIITGAYDDNGGTIYAFTKSGDDWVTEAPQIERIRLSGLSYSAHLGYSVAIDGNTIVAGATGVSTGGAAYILEKQGNSWTTPAVRKLQPATLSSGDQFGNSVAIEGNLIVVGAYGDDENGLTSGAAYVYAKSGSSWISSSIHETRLTASDGEIYDEFGGAVATNGYAVLVGAIRGGAYLYESNGFLANSYGPYELKFTPHLDTISTTLFGYSVAISTTGLLIGATGTVLPDNENAITGAAFYYEFAGYWSNSALKQRVISVDTQDREHFGSAVALDGTTIAVGATGADMDGIDSGGAYVFYGPDYTNKSYGEFHLNSELPPGGPLTASNVEDFYGHTLAMNDDYLIVGAPGTDSTLAPGGGVYIYAKNDHGTPDFDSDDSWIYETTLSGPNPEELTLFGSSIAIFGDTIVVGTYTKSGQYEVFIYEKNGSDWTTTPPTVTSLFDTVSRTVNIDLNNTYEDLIAFTGDTIVIGNPEGDGVEANSGVVYVYTRNGTDWSSLAPEESILYATNGATDREFGAAVDIDGDTIVVGTPGWLNGWTVYVYEKQTDWNDAVETSLYNSTVYTGGGEYGSAVAISGDTVFVGSPRSIEQRADSGAVYIFDGSMGWENAEEIEYLPTAWDNFYGYGKKLIAVDNTLIVASTHGPTFFYDGSAGWETQNESVVYSPSYYSSGSTRDDQSIAYYGNHLITDDDIPIYGTPLPEDDRKRVTRINAYTRPVPTFIIDNTEIVEGNDGTQTLNLTVTLGGLTSDLYDQNITIDYTTLDGTATTASGDYQAQTGTLSFNLAAGTATQTRTISIQINGDEKIEPHEYFSVILKNPSIKALIPREKATVTIRDNDTAFLNISDTTAYEGDGTATLTLTLDKEIEYPFTVNYYFHSGTAILFNDFQQADGSVTFNPGELSKTFTVPIVDDDKVELDETFWVNIVADVSPTDLQFTNSTADITIVDDDQAIVSIDDVSVDEESGTASLVVSLDNPVDGTITIDYATTDQTALAGEDYQATSGTLTFNPGEQSKTIIVDLINSDLLEVDKTFLVNLSNLQNSGLDVILPDSQAEVTILDSDQPSLSINDVVINEDAGTATVTVSLNQALSSALTVDFTTANDSAASPSDYQALSGTLTFNPGETSKSINISIIDSDVVEPNEIFLINLTNPQSSEYQITLSDSQSVVTIQDDDQSTISINDVTINENMETATLTVSLDHEVEAPISINYSTADGSALSSSDYQSTSGILAFAPGETSKTVTISIHDSALVEMDETFFVNLSNLQANGANVILADTQGVVTIHDDDQASISINDLSVDENAGTVALTVSLDRPVDTTVSVDFETLNGTALNASDYTTTSGTLTFNPGETTQTITLTIIDDGLTESPESFFVNLTNLHANGFNVALGNDQAEITITDDDQAILSIDDIVVNEDVGTATLTVSLDHILETAVSVDYQTVNGTAVENLDFLSSTGTVTFNPGDVSQTITVSIINSDTVEQTESMQVLLTNLQVADNLVSMPDPQGEIEILDDDQATISIDDVSVNENLGFAELTVSLSQAVDNLVTVDFFTSQQSAFSGVDYEHSAGTLTFNPDVLTQKITINLVDNELVEIDETFRVFLNKLQSNNSDVIFVDVIGQVTIVDDDQATITIDDVSVDEDAGTAVLTVSLPQIVTTPVTIDYSTFNGTAISGSDYLATSGTLTFNFREHTKTITVSLIDLDRVEADETFGVNLSNIQSSTADVVFADNQGEVTIVDDDQATISINDVTVNEAAGTATISVSLSQAVDTDISLNYATTDQTAFDSVDYLSKSGNVTFYSGSKSRNITVDLVDDQFIELDETFFVDLSNFNFNGFDVIVSDHHAVVTIQDNDLVDYEFKSKLHAVNPEVNNDLFGSDVAVDGDTMISSALYWDADQPNQGAAFIYVRNDQGTPNHPEDDTWEYQATLLAPNPAVGDSDRFGWKVAISGDTAVVGAPYQDGSGVNSGSLYVYTRSGNTWSFQQELSVPETTDNDYFGNVIAIEGDTIVVGVQSTDNFTGAAYVFNRANGIWSKSTTLVAEDADENDYFGNAVDIENATIVIGARHDSETISQSGAVYVFNFENGIWSQTQKIKDSTPGFRREFGVSISLEGNDLLIGSSSNRDLSYSSGKADLYTFDPENNLWNHSQTLTASDAAHNSHFGIDVLIKEDLILIGAVYDPASNNFDPYSSYTYGAVYVFEKENLNWVEQQKLDPAQSVKGDSFGREFDLSNGSIFVSSNLDDDEFENSGSVYVFGPKKLPEVSIGNLIVSEGDNGLHTVSVDVTRTGTNPGDLIMPASVDFQSIDGTATVSAGDYQVILGTINFGSEITSLTQTETITFQVFGDTRVEFDETFGIELSNLTGYAQLTQSMSTITIQNDDQAAISIDDVTVNEAMGTATLTVSLDQPLNTSISVDFATAANNSATSTFDYLSTSGTVTFNAEEQTKTFTVSIINSDLVELDETFLINLTNLQANGADVILGDDQATVTITDDDQASLTIDDLTVDENAGTATLTVSLDSPVDTSVSVDYTTADQTATAPDDFTSTSGTLTFNPGDQSQTIVISITNSDQVELTETFLVNLSGIQANGRNISFADDQAQVTIHDDDQATISIDDVTVDENTGTAMLTVSLDLPVDTTISVDYATADQTAAAPNDFTSTSGTLTFNPGDQSQTFVIPITNSDQIELDETFLVNLTNLQANGANIILGDNQATVTITDDDQAAISINDVTVDENAGTAILTVSLNLPVDTAISVDYTTAEGTASSPNDYTNTSGTLTFNPGDLSQTIVIPITDTDQIELDETFLVNLTNLQANGADIILGDNQAIVTITDNDQAGISIDDVSVDENAGTATLTVSLDSPVDTTVSVDFATADQTAAASDDYTSTSGTLTFNPGDQQKSITVSLVDSDLLEPDETFLVNLFNLQADGRNVTLTDSQAEVTILDDEIATAEINVRVVNTPTSTQPNGEAAALPENQNWISEWSTYWVEIWIDAHNPTEQGVFSAALDFNYTTEYTSATEIQFGAAFTQNQTGVINDQTGTVESLSAETNASRLGAKNQLLFARIKFEPLADDQVALDLSGKSIGPHDLGLGVSSAQVNLEGNIPATTNPGSFNGASIYANPLDFDDNDAINIRDLIIFINVYNSVPSTSSSDYSWFADLDQNDHVNIRDLILFIGNYGKNKSGSSPVNYPDNYPDDWNDLLTVDAETEPPSTPQTISQSTAETALESVVEQVSPALSASESETLEQIDIQVVDLEGDTLGRAAAGTIYIDVNAAGYGWFVDTTPTDHSEFAGSSELTLIALPDSEAAGQIDLLTVILHELGHILGYEHENEGVMQDGLAPGVRNLPTWGEDLDDFFSDLTDDTEMLFF